MLITVIETLFRTIQSTIVIPSVAWEELFSTSLTGNWLPSSTPIHIGIAFLVFGCMVVSGNKHKVFNSVVRFIAIDMMNKLAGFKWSTEMFAHNVTMFCYITLVTILQRIRMFWFEKIDITIGRNKATSFPTIIITPLVTMSSNISSINAMFHAPKSAVTWFKLLTTTAFTFHGILLLTCIIPHLKQVRTEEYLG